MARLDADGLSSAAIDRAVSAALERGEHLYAIDEAVLAELRPDIVITQTLCRVCAVEGDGVRRTLRARGLGAEVIELEPDSVEGVLDSIMVVGRCLGVADPRSRSSASCGRGWRRVAAERTLERPAVFVAEWLDPPFAAGHWVPEMIDLAGGREVLGGAGESSFRTTWDEVRRGRPRSPSSRRAASTSTAPSPRRRPCRRQRGWRGRRRCATAACTRSMRTRSSPAQGRAWRTGSSSPRRSSVATILARSGAGARHRLEIDPARRLSF